MYQNNPLDEKIDRKHSDSVKYGAGNRDPEREKLLPLWVADMDFRVPDPVIKALRDRTEHGIFGYGAAEENYYDAVCGWFRTHFHFDVDPRWIVTTPGVVFALSAAIRTFTEKGDAVLINRPVYYPFSNLIDGLKRRLINSPLQLKDGRYEIDFADVEEKIVSSGVRLYLLCSPHNPVGRVWTREELKKLGDICLKHDVLIVADEIHCDFVWSDHPHTVFASLGEPYRRRCILCTAPSKTFNLVGSIPPTSSSLTMICAAVSERRSPTSALPQSTSWDSPPAAPPTKADCRGFRKSGIIFAAIWTLRRLTSLKTFRKSA